MRVHCGGVSVCPLPAVASQSMHFDDDVQHRRTRAEHGMIHEPADLYCWVTT